MRKLLKYFSILIVIIWMGIVFQFSSESSLKSENTSNHFTKTILGENITDQRVEELSFMIRKTAHFTLYTIGGVCICLCVMLNYEGKKNIYLIGFSIGSIYAITDEIHQLFVPGRACELRDVIIDSLGILVGVVIIKFFKLIIYHLKRSEDNG
ncbi:MAG: VanZ family protein [Clostridia bacterium]|nr:VanZ family protein [Clostridia bacterium]